MNDETKEKIERHAQMTSAIIKAEWLKVKPEGGQLSQDATITLIKNIAQACWIGGYAEGCNEFIGDIIAMEVER